jgi:hypothetical protein
MSTDLLLRQRAKGTPLNVTNIKYALVDISKDSELEASLEKNAIRVCHRLEHDDPNVATIGVSFSHAGNTLTGTSRGRGTPVLHWCFHRLASMLGCAIEDPLTGAEVKGPNPEDFLEEAMSVIEAHETEVLSTRRSRPPPADVDLDLDEDDLDEDDEDDEDAIEDADGVLREFLEHMVRADKLLLASPEFEDLQELRAVADDPEALYEAILDSEEVEDVFVSESL